MQEVFGPGGLIAQHHPNYEYRPGQIEMAEAVSDTLEGGGIALIEAGTGTGKTLAYLIPALASGRRVIVATATKNLQEQLYKKDIPFLQEIIPRKFKAVCMKGRSNYVCLHRLKKADEMPILEGLEDVDYFDEIRRWAGRTETGDRAELTELPENLSFWPQIDARAETCLGQKCPEFDSCFITRMRREAVESDVVIVNHHLFFADLALRGGDYGAVLPDYSTIIFDEAHELEDVAASYFGSSVSNYRINDLIQDAQKLVITEPDQAAELTKALARLAQRGDAFWLSFRGQSFDDDADEGGAGDSSQGGYQQARYKAYKQSYRRAASGLQDGRYTLNTSHFIRTDKEGNYETTAAGEAYIALTNAIDRLTGVLGVLKNPPPEVDNISRRAESLKFDLEFIVMGDEPSFVYWYEKRGRGLFLHATPIDVSGILEEKLFSNMQSAVLTSATMTAGGSFDFIKGRLGIGDARQLIVESHFDFENQAVLYLPPGMPDPRSRDFLDASVEEIVRILEATRGRAFVLFTSVSSMRQTYELVRQLVDFPVFIQGQGSKIGLLEKFRSTDGAVLFATSSFWQGVDVQGEALSCVIISKLPFAVPTDPVVAARQKYIDDQGGNSFYEYSVPQAAITLKQGLGRLIRSTTDRGVLSILDPRLKTKSYGRFFLQSIPQCHMTASLKDAAAIFNE
ncbi:MAG TPA: ATP-dependent DNA helicase [Blastocatellia bacterium]|jgi:ATP-dependent DNA helicase DinG|nr:ATP-dependent DNA helicase [Blastocatellia bacterium]